MPNKLTTLRRILLAALFFHAAGVQADCVDTVPLSPQERDFVIRASAALQSFLRPAPSSEPIRTSDSVTDPAGIQACKGEKKDGNFDVSVSRKYIWPDPKKHSADTAITMHIAINVRSFDTRAGEHSGAYGSPSPGLSAGLTLNNVEWKVDAASYGVPAQRESLRASLAAVIDRDRLAALVGKPLPSVATSTAMAKKAGPTPLITPEPSASAAAPAPTHAAIPLPSGASPSPASPPSAPAAPTPTDMLKDAADTAQKLRGLFGR